MRKVVNIQMIMNDVRVRNKIGFSNLLINYTSDKPRINY